MTRLVGADGWIGGWVLAVLHDDRLALATAATAAQLLAVSADAVGIDIPIGLPDAGVRAADGAARARLGRRRSTVFDAPLRPVLAASTYAEARELLARGGHRSMSAQAWGLVAKVREVDRALSRRTADRVVEVHPEVSFQTMAGGELPAKKTVRGMAARIELLLRWRGDVLVAMQTCPPGPRIDDVLDALAVLWSVQRWQAGTAEVLPAGADRRPPRDARGLPMRIVF
jgi:predicted RNase H-like nuclease